ncbi:hypothetical protein BHE75_01919 [Sphingomonas haloaromaticamans]|uniref:Uncharacterized protein n=1 Tax=Edaphosphingomonas haloaromaticamans TaxID=653954 RepID=A0A1S1HEJ7_9SPHN|nr:hypothetical protein BHE75_01919 [Sphingomonas haloaromaticamans]
MSDVRVTSTSWNERRHEFLQADGYWKMCAGPGFCRECNREAIRNQAANRPI